MATLTSKLLHISCKNGHTPEYMMEKYGFSSEEELYATIRRVSPSGQMTLSRGWKRTGSG